MVVACCCVKDLNNNGFWNPRGRVFDGLCGLLFPKSVVNSRIFGKPPQGMLKTLLEVFG